MTVNLQVVRRCYPVCRPYVERSGCRSCRMLEHVSELYGSRTLCGKLCSSLDGWVDLPDKSPEDVDAVDRCLPCYAELERMKARDREDRPFAY